MVQSRRFFMPPTQPKAQTWPFIGHAELGRHLMQQLAAHRLPPAILFVGPRSVGKSSAAIWLAQWSLCTNKTSRPCGACPACRQILAHAHPNATILRAGEQSSIGIEEIRSALHQYELVSWDAGWRWLVITEAERLTEAATNTMLKFLEELPPEVRVIMTSSYPERLLPTLRSRTTIYQWHFVAPDELSPAGSGRDIAARSAGRPGWRQLLRDAANQQADQAMAVSTSQQLRQTQPASKERLSKDRSVVEKKMEYEEIVVREMLLSSVGSRRRLLWPSGDFTGLPIPSALTVATKYLDRYDLSPNLQSRLLYEDLHLV